MCEVKNRIGKFQKPRGKELEVKLEAIKMEKGPRTQVIGLVFPVAL